MALDVRLFKGTRDYLPDEMLLRERILERMRELFRRFGFAPLETPALEYLETLAGKYGAEGDRLIYRLAYKGGDVLALRYDLTVPLARVVALYPELGRPFKRYQIQPVWRADTPQPHQGRYREFVQCDVDTIGTEALLADAEIVALMVAALEAAGFESFKVRINSRKILTGLVQHAGLALERTPEVCRAIDKFDKVGRAGVERELAALELGPAQNKLLELLELPGGLAERLEALRRCSDRAPELRSGAAEIEQLFELLAAMRLDSERLGFDLHLARGLDYYTGPIFEAVLPAHPHVGSLSGGGRYDGLIGVFTGEPVPAVGVSLGLDRMVTALRQLRGAELRASVSRVLVANFGAETLPAALAALGRLRAAGIAAEIYLQPDRLKKQFGYADRRGIPYVMVIGPEEAAGGAATLKQLATGRQERLPLDQIVGRLSAG
jgi:histidyl-tRNA synthetase